VTRVGPLALAIRVSMTGWREDSARWRTRMAQAPLPVTRGGELFAAARAVDEVP
jgi:hypothetical protein